MENNITDLFEDFQNITDKSKEKNTGNKKDKSSSLKSSMMMEAMSLMSNPKKLKGIIAIVVLLLLIGIISTIAFFVIYPVCIIWAIGSYMILATGGKIIKSKKDVHGKGNS